jgi:hypothetical protein
VDIARCRTSSWTLSREAVRATKACQTGLAKQSSKSALTFDSQLPLYLQES